MSNVFSCSSAREANAAVAVTAKLVCHVRGCEVCVCGLTDSSYESMF